MSGRVSIVTPSFNQARFLPATLASLRAQDYPAIEHLVMDGGSTDGSVDILRQTTGLQWVSEPDAGQVAALNKGFERATGDVLAWLNADDLFFPNTVATAMRALTETGADLVYGDLDIMDESGRVLRQSHGIPFDYRVLLYGINYIGQQTVFFRRSLWERAGPLRADLDNAFDHELWLRMAAHGRLVYVPGLRAQIRYHAAAKSVARAGVTAENTQRIRREYWARGGWPACFQKLPWFWIPHYGYRLKRQLQIQRRPG